MSVEFFIFRFGKTQRSSILYNTRLSKILLYKEVLLMRLSKEIFIIRSIIY